MDLTIPLHRIPIQYKPQIPDPEARQLLSEVDEFLNLRLEDVKIVSLYTIHKPLTPLQVREVGMKALADTVLEVVSTEEEAAYDWMIEVGFKNGVTDNAGTTAQAAIEDLLQAPFENGESVRTSKRYYLYGELSRQDVEKIAVGYLANPLIKEIQLRKNSRDDVETIPIDVSEEELCRISQIRHLALNLEEMLAIQTYYSCEKNMAGRAGMGLPPHPTDVELEALAQTWSEHCKHKIFNARIRYTDDGCPSYINSLFHTYIKGATLALEKKCPWLVSVFTDNAGIIEFNDTYNLAFKVETHNSPSALDPYGGALTGILGVNRDILGAGIGARLLANTDIFCFAPPDYKKEIPERLHHPKRVFEGVRRGVEHGGNKSGVPTVNGAVVFDEGFLGKPLVFCGTVGIMPRTLNERPTHLKEINNGDLVVIAGGRTGKDGIHGATFSSEEIHADSPVSAVQIGDPFTQKKLCDFLIDARDAGLYRAVTDNGAGGLSSSVGELARITGGCEVHLEKAPLKYPGLKPWEILVSESQERMTFAVDPEKWSSLKILAALHEVEVAAVGTFTESGDFHIFYQGKTVACLPMEFLHEGVPQLALDAEWCSTPEASMSIPFSNLGEDLHALLSSYNICSKETVIRQYDHEVQGGSVLKPLVGINNDGPSDAAIVRPIECWDSPEGVVISNGICPRLSEFDTYHMAANAIDEAIRNCVAVGGDPATVAILDNFCWPDPIYDPVKTPDGKYKLAQLVRANQALHHYAVAFETPIISGKDSMKNDYKIANHKISIQPTLLISAVAKIPDVERAVTMDVKCPGDWIYVIGLTKSELGGSEFSFLKGVKGGAVPTVDAGKAKVSYHSLHQAIIERLVSSCHDCSDGGLAVALAESAFAGGYGMEIDLEQVPVTVPLNPVEILFSESPSRFVVTLRPDKAKAFENVLSSSVCRRIGIVTEKPFLVIRKNAEPILNEKIDSLKRSWLTPLGNGETDE